MDNYIFLAFNTCPGSHNSFNYIKFGSNNYSKLRTHLNFDYFTFMFVLLEQITFPDCISRKRNLGNNLDIFYVNCP